ncbi:MAG TPA: hypothetical protein VNX00_06625 [Herbaspirillum sp.]|nr:hypothetical protein [Herbaspirillum sp.]
MPLPRIVAAETLDFLSPDDPDAIRSRRDLRRIHRMMGTRSIILDALGVLGELHGAIASENAVPARPLRILELGAGDGRLMLGVARALTSVYPHVELTLLDRQALVAPATISGYAVHGWRTVAKVADVLDWAAADIDPLSKDQRWDLIIANLFLHHFEVDQLTALLQASAMRTDLFIACEPRRARLALLGSHLVGVIGANKVTREDAVLSVHAGFRGGEISMLWPGLAPQWQVKEYPAGLFTHCFRAMRVEPANAD